MSFVDAHAQLQAWQEEAYSALLKHLISSNKYGIMKVQLVLSKIQQELNISDDAKMRLLAEAQSGGATARPAAAPSSSQPTTSLVRAPSMRATAAGGRGGRLGKRPSVLLSESMDELDGEPEPKPRKARKSAAGGGAYDGVDPIALLGRKVSRWWGTYNKWYEGVLTDYRESSDEHMITYQIGTPKEEYEWYNIGMAPATECQLLDETVNLKSLQNKSKAVQSSVALGLKKKGGAPKA